MKAANSTAPSDEAVYLRQEEERSLALKRPRSFLALSLSTSPPLSLPLALWALSLRLTSRQFTTSQPSACMHTRILIQLRTKCGEKTSTRSDTSPCKASSSAKNSANQQST